jgi:glycosyltransferase involved in cell wall biosynthesis
MDLPLDDLAFRPRAIPSQLIGPVVSEAKSAQSNLVAAPLRVAVVHDWLDKVGGAERVLHNILQCFPQADLFAVVDMMSAADRNIILGKKVGTTFIQRLPGARKHFRRYLPLMPLAIEQLDLSAYDLVISSSWAVAKGVITGSEQLHVAYVHTPIRYAWDQQHNYLHQSGLVHGLRSTIVRLALHRMRLWDIRTAPGVDVWIANSSNVARRIRKTYRQKAAVLHPSIPVDDFPFSRVKQDFYLTCSRLVQYKRIDIIIEAFIGTPDRRLIVAGDGPEALRLRHLARAARNISFVGRKSDAETRELMKSARAFIFAADEDFGIVPLEAQACGTPVIAYGKGGALETVAGLGSENPTGCFFFNQTAAAISEAISVFEALPQAIDASQCRANAYRFSFERFRERLHELVRDGWTELMPSAPPSGCLESKLHRPAPIVVVPSAVSAVR